MNTSDQACARYIIPVLMQEPGENSKLQLAEMGKHCSRFTTKNTMVHITVKLIMTQKTTEKFFVGKILV